MNTWRTRGRILIQMELDNFRADRARKRPKAISGARQILKKQKATEEKNILEDKKIILEELNK